MSRAYSYEMLQDQHSAEYRHSRLPNIMPWWDIDLFWPLLIVSQVSGVAVVSILTFWITEYIPTKFAWYDRGLIGHHALMSTLGMVFLFGEGMLLFNVPRRLNLRSHFVLKVMHGVTLGVGVIFAIVGLKAIIYFKKSTDRDEFYSVHSWLGMTAAMLFFFQHGVAMFFYILSKCFNPRFMIRFTDLHKFFGYVLFAMSIAACASGMDRWAKAATYGKTYTGRPTPTLLGDLYGLLMLLFGTVVAFIASRPPPKRSNRTKTGASSDIESKITSKELLDTDLEE